MQFDETCKLIEFKEFHKNTHHEGGESGQGDSEEEDEGHRGGGQRV